jgi:hypothetical protein
MWDPTRGLEGPNTHPFAVPLHRNAGPKRPPDIYQTVSWQNSQKFGCRGFSEVGNAFLAEALLNPAVGQPLGEQILGALGPPAGLVS